KVVGGDQSFAAAVDAKAFPRQVTVVIRMVEMQKGGKTGIAARLESFERFAHEALSQANAFPSVRQRSPPPARRRSIPAPTTSRSAPSVRQKWPAKNAKSSFRKGRSSQNKEFERKWRQHHRREHQSPKFMSVERVPEAIESCRRNAFREENFAAFVT